jgi:hypothetical protein
MSDKLAAEISLPTTKKAVHLKRKKIPTEWQKLTRPLRISGSKGTFLTFG